MTYSYIDDRKSACDHRNIKLYYLHFGFHICRIYRRWTDNRFYYYEDQSNGSLIIHYLIIETFFGGDWSFCWLLMTIDCWWLGKRWTYCCWEFEPTFRGELKNWLPKGSKKDATICVKNWTYVRNTKEKRALLIWNWTK